MAPGLCDHWSFLRPLFGDAAASSSTARTTAAVSKAPRAVVEEAFAEHVRGFMESNPGCEGTMEVLFEDIFACLEDEFVLKAAPLPPVSAAADSNLTRFVPPCDTMASRIPTATPPTRRPPHDRS